MTAVCSEVEGKGLQLQLFCTRDFILKQGQKPFGVFFFFSFFVDISWFELGFCPFRIRILTIKCFLELSRLGFESKAVMWANGMRRR